MNSNRRDVWKHLRNGRKLGHGKKRRKRKLLAGWRDARKRQILQIRPDKVFPWSPALLANVQALLCENEKLREPASPSHLAHEKIALGPQYTL